MEGMVGIKGVGEKECMDGCETGDKSLASCFFQWKLLWVPASFGATQALDTKTL